MEAKVGLRLELGKFSAATEKKQAGTEKQVCYSIKVTFMNSKGEKIKTVEGNEGDDIVDLSWEYDLDIEGALVLPTCLKGSAMVLI